MRIGMQDIDWSYVGAVFARADDNEQAEFVKAVVKECLTWGTRQQIEMQFAGVNNKLTEDEKSIIGMIGWEENK